MKKTFNNGITLIALVITIIVILILAGISIVMLTGENGILTKARQAKEESDYSAAEEKVKIAILEYQVKMKSETLYNILQKIEGLEEINPNSDMGGPPYTIIVDGYIFCITENLEVQGIGKSNGIVPEIIKVEELAEEKNKKETKILIQAKTEDKEGIEKVILIKKDLVTLNLEEFEEKFKILVRQMFSFMDVGENTAENFYHAFVLGMLVGLKDTYYVNSNRESGIGRYDIMLEPKDKTKNSFIMEFKVHKSEKENTLEDTIKNAKKQIEEKGYEENLKERGFLNITKMVFAFCGKEVKLEIY